MAVKIENCIYCKKPFHENDLDIHGVCKDSFCQDTLEEKAE